MKLTNNKKQTTKNYSNKNLLSVICYLLSKHNAFTLIELIVVMAILAILAGALWGNFFSSIIKGRDSRRKQDLESVTKALDLYYFDNRAYPTALPGQGTPFLHPENQNVIYMQNLPLDPSYPTSDYCYASNGTYYKYYAKLENMSDQKIFTTPAVCQGDNGYNYGISSPNTTP